MIFKIEFSDQRFRVVAPNGEFEEAVTYCMVSTVEYQGKVYGAYLTGSEEELESLSGHPTQTTMKAKKIKVYDLTAWPSLSGNDAELEEIEFDEDDDDDQQVLPGEELDEEEQDAIDVEPTA